jgi:hypothetical protein
MSKGGSKIFREKRFVDADGTVKPVVVEKAATAARREHRPVPSAARSSEDCCGSGPHLAEKGIGVGTEARGLKGRHQLNSDCHDPPPKMTPR